MDQEPGLGHASARAHSGEQIAASIDRATQIAGVGRSSLYHAMKTGELPYLKVGKRRLIMIDDLRAWLERPRVDGVEAA